jgi:tRNA-splicing ligase RtcB
MSVMTDLRYKQIDAFRWEIPRTGGMRVPGLVFAEEAMLPDLAKDQSPRQVANVAHLPGILRYSMAMPDIHWGYGFPIGGVAAMDVDEGVISPGGVGYDINCGVRLATLRIPRAAVVEAADRIAAALSRDVPAGVGAGASLALSARDLRSVLSRGARALVERGIGEPRDLEHCEENGEMPDADPDAVSERARERGRAQLGSLGSGNHFLEVDVVAEVYDEDVAREFGLDLDQTAILIHCGSRGLGHQVCDDFLREMGRRFAEQYPHVPDRQLVCAPIRSPVGRRYVGAMNSAANFAWANRHLLMVRVAESLGRTLGLGPRDVGLRLVYDVSHNMAKFETHDVGGRRAVVCVHRKGATRAFPAGHAQVPAAYRATGQPVIIPGDMGRGSFVLVGEEQAMRETFGSSCHGAGRLKSRGEAKRRVDVGALEAELRGRGVVVRAKERGTLGEEAPLAYKDVGDVVRVVDGAGLSRRVARLQPLVVIKG